MRVRWSDNDRYWWRFTYAHDSGFRPLAAVLGSGDDDYPGCRLRLSGFGHTLIVALPQIIRPWRRKVFPNWDAATVARLGRDYYYDTHSRNYGFQLSDGFLQIFYGRCANDSSAEKQWCTHLPWTQWRHVRSSLYGLKGEPFWTEPKGARWDARLDAVAACPSRSFEFEDFDGERLTAKTYISEMEWRFGEGWFKWLSLFRKPMIKRSLDIQFSGETGQRKGSWKGGTVGHSIEMLPGELHEAAFERYCDKRDMTFIGEVMPCLIH